jgi:hypothetical protein
MDAWPVKDPDEVLDYQFDWATHRLEAGETISSSTFSKTGSITLGATSDASGITTVWISGGTAGEACVVTNQVVTSAGRTYEASAKLRIRNTDGSD